jgi:hypothetical protein
VILNDSSSITGDTASYGDEAEHRDPEDHQPNRDHLAFEAHRVSVRFRVGELEAPIDGFLRTYSRCRGSHVFRPQTKGLAPEGPEAPTGCRGILLGWRMSRWIVCLQTEALFSQEG